MRAWVTYRRNQCCTGAGSSAVCVQRHLLHELPPERPLACLRALVSHRTHAHYEMWQAFYKSRCDNVQWQRYKSDSDLDCGAPRMLSLCKAKSRAAQLGCRGLTRNAVHCYVSLGLSACALSRLQVRVTVLQSDSSARRGAGQEASNDRGGLASMWHARPGMYVPIASTSHPMTACASISATTITDSDKL